MNLDGFVTFLALAAAIYAVVPPVARLRVRLAYALQLPIAIIALLLVLYFEFYEFAQQPCLQAFAWVCRGLYFPADRSITPNQIAFLVVLVWMFVAWVVYRLSRPTAGALPAMSRLIDSLVYEKRFAEVLQFVEPHLQMIERAARRELALQKSHDWIAAFKSRRHSAIGILRDSSSSVHRKSAVSDRVRQLAVRGFATLAVLVPPQTRAEGAAKDILRSLFRSPEIIQFMATMRPYAAIPFLRIDTHEVYDFSDRFFELLIADSTSVLYTEVRNNQNVSHKEGYAFPESNRLLHFLFSDLRVAEKLHVWKPLGDFALRQLRSDMPPSRMNYLNGSRTNSTMSAGRTLYMS